MLVSTLQCEGMGKLRYNEVIRSLRDFLRALTGTVVLVAEEVMIPVVWGDEVQSHQEDSITSWVNRAVGS